nr:MAG TPA: Baseplate wedge protein [Caudoviricetes sp.]
MATSNFLVFNEVIDEFQTMNDSEYSSDTQRKKGVGSGIANRRLHNKLYRQTSIMAAAMAAFCVSQGYSATDDNVATLQESLTQAIQHQINSSSDFKGATAAVAGRHGYVPAPPAGANNKLLTGAAEYKSLNDFILLQSGDIDYSKKSIKAATRNSGDSSLYVANTAFVSDAVENALTESKGLFFKSVSAENDKLTFTRGDNTTSSVKVDKVNNASTANYLVTNENGCIYHDLSKVSAGADVNLHVNWNAKDTTRKILKYIFHDAKGTGNLADLQAKTVYANLDGNATSASKASKVVFTRGNEIVLEGTPSQSDKAWLGYRSEGYSGPALKKWMMGDLTGTGGLAAVEAKEFIGPATVLKGIYTQNGGKQPLGYFGRNTVGALMSNESVMGDTSYKNWLYMDHYEGSDAGGATAFGISRTGTRAFIARSNSDRGPIVDSAELLTTKGGHTVSGSMTFNGTVTTKSGIIIPTRSRGDNTTYAASTAFVQDAINALINGSPGALDTLKELAAALGNDANFASTIAKQLGLKAPLASPSFTGTVTGPTPSTSANNTQFATTAWVLSRIAALSTGPIIGDVSSANGWWIKIPCVGFNLLIQGVYLYNVAIDSYWVFPVSFKTLFTVLGNDVNDKDYNISTQLLTFSDYSPTKVKLGATTIDRRLTKFFGRVIAIGIV